MTDEGFIEHLRKVTNVTIAELGKHPDQIVELRAGRLRLTITGEGVDKERLVPQLTLYTK